SGAQSPASKHSVKNYMSREIHVHVRHCHRDKGFGRGLGVGVDLTGIGVGVPEKVHSVTKMLSTRQPSPEPLLSLAILHRSLPSITSKGRFTVFVMRPPDFPLHA